MGVRRDFIAGLRPSHGHLVISLSNHGVDPVRLTGRRWPAPDRPPPGGPGGRPRDLRPPSREVEETKAGQWDEIAPVITGTSGLATFSLTHSDSAPA